MTSVRRRSASHEVILHVVGNGVAVPNGEVAGNADVEIGQQDETALADAAFFHAGDTADGSGEGFDSFHEVG